MNNFGNREHSNQRKQADSELELRLSGYRPFILVFLPLAIWNVLEIGAAVQSPWIYIGLGDAIAAIAIIARILLDRKRRRGRGRFLLAPTNAPGLPGSPFSF